MMKKQVWVLQSKPDRKPSKTFSKRPAEFDLIERSLCTKIKAGRAEEQCRIKRGWSHQIIEIDFIV